MKTLTCMIVDDEPLAVKMLEDFVSRTPYLRLAASFNDPVLALSTLCESEKARQWFEMNSVKEERGSLFVRVDSQLRQVEISRILYVTGLKDYVMIYLEGEARPLITHVTMKAMEEMLSTGRFMRVHRSYIVALDKIRSVDRNNCVYIGKEIIHVTDAYKEAFNAYLKAAQPS